MGAVCDLCKKRFESRGVENAKIPVLYLNAVNPLARTYTDPEAFSRMLSEYKGEWTLGYSNYNLCNECLQKIVSVRFVPFIEKTYFGGLSPDIVYRGKYKAVIATSDFDVGAESLKAYEENNTRACDSCVHTYNEVGNGELMCSVSKINAKDSYEFYCKWFVHDKGCPEWEHDAFMGRNETGEEDGKQLLQFEEVQDV